MSTVIVSPFNVVNSPGVGGHFWVYLQYVRGLQALGCEVYWLERFVPSPDPIDDERRIAAHSSELRRFGMDRKVILYEEASDGSAIVFRDRNVKEVERLMREADLLLNFHYSINPQITTLFSRTAFVDIDPGLLQFWVAAGQIRLTPHDVSFTIGETVGRPDAPFPDCGLDWNYVRPAVSLEDWPFAEVDESTAFRTVSSWWGASGKGEFITDGEGLLYENNKRYWFLRFIDIPRHLTQPLELALFLGEGDDEPSAVDPGGREVGTYDPEYRGLEMYRYTGDHEDRRLLETHGWKVRHSRDVAGTPTAYWDYLRHARGEFSCAKPSCMRFQNAWISDRSLCFLASGRPVVLQDTGPSEFLPNGEGVFRFTTAEEAVDSVLRINSEYAKQRDAARQVAEAYFDARDTVRRILDRAL